MGYENLQSECTDGIRRILRYLGVVQASMYAEKHGQGQHWTVLDNDEVQSSDITNNEDTIIYGIGSQTKQLVALLLSIIVDTLSYSKLPKHRKFRALRDKWNCPWDARFTDVFNSFSSFSNLSMSTLPGEPTLRHVALHFNSLPPLTHILLAVDGTSIMAKESFLRVSPGLAHNAYKESTGNYIEYSNGNYSLIGCLIEAIGQDSLAVLMKEHLFEPLKMYNTYMVVPDSSTACIAQPYVVSANDVRKRVDPWPYRTESVVTPALGACSCTRDWAILLRTIQACINGDESIFTKEFIMRFLAPNGILGGIAGSISLFGICTTLNTSTPGCMSSNRLIAPDNQCSSYPLGYKHGMKEVKGYYLAGTTIGYTSSTYFIPKENFFVIVFTNTTGFADAADHISRFILQKTFDLSFTSKSKVVPFTRLLHKRKASGSQMSDPTKKVVDIIAMSSLTAAAGKELLQRLSNEDAQQNIPDALPLHLEGKYYNERTEQSIIIEGNQAQILGTASGALGGPQMEGIIRRGNSSTPEPMGFIRTGHFTIRLRPLSESGFTIDRYDPHSWKYLTFDLHTAKNKCNDVDKVMCLTRQLPYFLEKFERIETDIEMS